MSPEEERMSAGGKQKVVKNHKKYLVRKRLWRGVGLQAAAVPVPEAAPTPVPEDAPATPELAVWPEVGVKVAVGVENLAHCLRLGETGVSQGPAPDEPSEVIVMLDAASVLAPVRIPRSLLVSVGANMRNMRLWDRTSEGIKRDLLLQLGVRDPRDEELPKTASFTLTVWGEWVPIGLRIEEHVKYHFVQPAFVQAFEDGSEMMKKVGAGESDVNFAELEDHCHRQEMRQKLLQDWWNKFEVLLVCFCDEVSGSSALLVLRKAPFSARLYEAGVVGRETIAKQVYLVLSHLEGVSTEVPFRSNVAASDNEALIAHYIEGEIREILGETRGCLGWPPKKMKKMRGHLTGLRTSFERARKKWCNEENAIEAKRRFVNEAIVGKLWKTEETRKVFETRWNEVKARNLKALDEGSFEGPIVPIGFVPPEPRKVRAPRNEDKVEKISFLQVLDEPPEAPPAPKVSE